MDSEINDRDAMGRLAGGDRSALAELMRQWGPRVWCYIERMCGRLGCSEDLYQEVWMRVFLHRERYDVQRAFRPYLFTIASNCCRTALRRGSARLRRERSLDGEALSDPPGAAPQPLQTAIRREEARLLHAAVDQLPETQRSVVLLYLLGSADYAEIASALKKRPGTIRVHMHQALKRLRRALGQVARRPGCEVDDERPVS